MRPGDEVDAESVTRVHHLLLAELEGDAAERGLEAVHRLQHARPGLQ